MNKYVVMSLVAIAVITAQVAVAKDSPEMTKAKTEIDTLISNKNKAGLQALVEWMYDYIKTEQAYAEVHRHIRRAEQLNRFIQVAMAQNADEKMIENVRFEKSGAENAADRASEKADACFSKNERIKIKHVVATGDVDTRACVSAFGAAVHAAENVFEDELASRVESLKSKNTIAAELEKEDLENFAYQKAQVAKESVENLLFQYTINAATKADITFEAIDGLTIECISKALKKNVPFCPRINCSKLK